MKKFVFCLFFTILAFRGFSSDFNIWKYYDGLKKNDPKIVNFCLENSHYLDVFERNEENKSAAIKAIDKNDFNVLKVLAHIRSGEVFVTEDDKGNDCFMYAVINNKLTAFSAMLENIKDINEFSYLDVNDDGKNLLDLVMEQGKEEFAKLTFKYFFMQPYGAPNLAKLFNDQCPYVFTAVENGYIDVNYFFKKGNTLIHELCDIYYYEQEASEAINFLCKHGANVNVFNEEDETPFTIAMWNGYPKRSAAILANGYDVDMEDEFHQSAMTRTLTSVNKHPEVLEELCKTGIDLNKRLTGEYKNYTPLSYAIGKWNNWPCIEILLRYGADINLKDGWGNSPLDLLKTEEKKYYKLAKKAGYLNKVQEEIKKIKRFKFYGQLINREVEISEEWRSFDSSKRLIHYKDSKGDEYFFEYDEVGHKIHEKHSNGYEKWFEYDHNGNEVLSYDSNNNKKIKIYNNDNNLIYEKWIDTEKIVETWYEYNTEKNAVIAKQFQAILNSNQILFIMRTVDMKLIKMVQY